MQFQPVTLHNDDVSTLYGNKDPFQSGECLSGPVENNIIKDPLGLAERGKMGVVSYYNECISNDSIQSEPLISNSLKTNSMDVKSMYNYLRITLIHKYLWWLYLPQAIKSYIYHRKAQMKFTVPPWRKQELTIKQTLWLEPQRPNNIQCSDFRMSAWMSDPSWTAVKM